MSSCSAAPITESGCPNNQNALPDDGNVSKNSECPLEHGEDEEQDEDEEDMDFNPLLKETISLEASSSLSSELEELDGGIVDSRENTSSALFNTSLSKPPNQFQENDEEMVMQTIVSFQPQNETFNEKDNGSISGMDGDNAATFREFSSISDPRKLVMVTDDEEEDAICKRTRARYSLAQFTLDELETFLQETDDDDDLQNVDDEEEYRKFLAAVLLGGDGDDQAIQENQNVYDDDEDNDADFELEIEEALESDVDENISGAQDQGSAAACRRPETRQNRQKKVSVRPNKKHSGQLNRPLRPLLPNVPIAPFPVIDGKKLMLESGPHYPPSSAHNGFVNGFTPHQIGQLHCLIYEHVQLLIQVFSLCILEPAREQIASEVQGLILEMLHKRNELVAWKRVPYPSLCFSPRYIKPSVPHEVRQVLPAPSTTESFSQFEALENNTVPPSNSVCPSRGRYEGISSGQVRCSQTPEGSFWVPFISGTVLSVTDVAPLNLVGSYMDDVSIAVREYKRQFLGVISATRFEKEPLFPYRSFQSSVESNGEVPRGSRSDQTPKKTMAATLVEKTKKQSVAPVPRKIAELALRFFPLFNPGLYPHKPPPASVANRVLFTEAEDGLLAMGLMEYNTDWKAIQQRFLPCKSKHQIFVRQKNRSSSKAPENSIKAVRRMKNSPLTALEKAYIEEGLKVYKLDWMSVWKFVVPHRDPSLLPRQWRIATGTQKSYKADADKKAKRRLYELKRRNCKPAVMSTSQVSSEKEDCCTSNAGRENNSGDDCIDNEDQTYVHEAFLADWRPSTSTVREQGNEFPKTSQRLHTSSSCTHDAHNGSSMKPNQPVSHISSSSFKPQFWRPYRSRRTKSARLVKLAPDLPPVNLPPSVRIMSQSAFKSYQGGGAAASGKISGADSGLVGPANHNIVPKLPFVSSSGPVHHPIKTGQDKAHLQMHPLLFRAPEDGRLPYHPLNGSAGASSSSSFNFFSRNQPQLNLNLFHNPQQANHLRNFFDKSSNEGSSSSFDVNFHPLLQRADDVNTELVAADSTLRSHCAQPNNPIDSALTKSRVNNSSITTSVIPPSPNARTNELDLEIHLSYTSRKNKKAGEDRDVTENNIMYSTKRARDSESIETANVTNSGAEALVILSSDVNRNGVNDIGDQSLPEIVMEQEELSDSEEEEIGEHVEFECEEMADSEGEEEASDSEQFARIQNKEVPHVAMEKEVNADFDDEVPRHEPNAHGNYEGKGNVGGPSEGRFDDRQYEPRADGNSEGNVVGPAKGSSLTENERGGSGTKRRGASRSNRPCKKDAVDMPPQQSNTGSIAITPPRKPRKRVQRTELNLSVGRAKKREANLNSGAIEQISDTPAVSTNEFG